MPKEKGAHRAATEQPLDTSNATGKTFLDMNGVFAEFETNLCHERQAEEMDAAERRGTYGGRHPKIDMEATRNRLNECLSPTRIAFELGVSHGPVYKAEGKAGKT